MADYKVDTNQIRSYATQLRDVQSQMDAISVKLGAMQLGSMIQIKASTTLLFKVNDCRMAVHNQATNLQKMAKGIEEIAQIYDDCETALTEPKTQEQAESESSESFFEKLLEALEDRTADFAVPGALISMIMNFSDWNLDDAIDGVKSLLKAISGTAKSISTSDGKVKINWGALFGTEEKSALKNFGDQFRDEMGKYTDSAKNGKVSVVTTWVSLALSAVESGISNYEEFDGDITNSRFWSETVSETIVGTLTKTAVKAGVAVALTAVFGSAPALAIAGVSVAVLWASDAICEKIFGKKLTETISDFILDTGERAIGAVKALWSENCCTSPQMTGAW